MVRRALTIVALLFLFGAPMPGGARADIVYVARPFDVPFAKAVNTVPLDINNNGDIVGNYSNGPYDATGNPIQAFYFTNGVFSAFSLTTNDNVTLNAVNDLGVQAGAYQIYTERTAHSFPNYSHAFTLRSGDRHDISYPAASSFSPTGINNLFDVIGNLTVDGHESGFLDHDGAISLIDAPGAESTRVYGINDVGTIVGVADGETLFLYDNGNFSVPTLPFGRAKPIGAAINNKFNLAGTTFNPANSRFEGFVVKGGAMIPVIFGDFTVVTGINDAGTIVGYYSNPRHGDATEHGFIADPALQLSLGGGTTLKPVQLPGGLPIVQLKGTIGGIVNDASFYEFVWHGGAFDAFASLIGADSATGFEFELLAPDGAVLKSMLLDAANGFSADIDLASLAAGNYRIGLLALGVSDPDFTIDFRTPVAGVATVPEPASAVLVLAGLTALSLHRCVCRTFAARPASFRGTARPAVSDGDSPAWRRDAIRHIRNTPNRVDSIGALSAAEIDSASTSRVSAGSMMPSSHSRALA
jgi:hypothetical protein